jgi:hypothetical protein
MTGIKEKMSLHVAITGAVRHAAEVKIRQAEGGESIMFSPLF